MTLTEFLLARIAEDEAVAEAGLDYLAGGTLAAMPEAMQPARVLRKCEADRQVIEDCAQYEDEDYASTDGLALRTLLRLAAVYAEHPDYRDALKP